MVKELASGHDFQLKKYKIYKRAIWLSNVTWKVWFLVKAFYKKNRMAHLQADVKTIPSTTARAAPCSIPGLLDLEKEMIRNIYLKEEGWASHTAMMLGVLRKRGRCRCFSSRRAPLDVTTRRNLSWWSVLMEFCAFSAFPRGGGDESLLCFILTVHRQDLCTSMR